MYDLTGESLVFAMANIANGGANLGTPLMQMLATEALEPGAAAGYEMCKIIYTFHPLGAVLVDAPITRAQSQERMIKVPCLGGDDLVEAFNEEHATIGKIGATKLIHNVMTLKRVYGISSLAVGERNKSSGMALKMNEITADSDIYFNVLDPLNTAGSLVLDQNPNSPNFLKPDGPLIVNGVAWHTSRTLTTQNESPIYIDWNASSFGFTGRSIYQRALFPLKSYLQTLITDQMIVQKVGLLIAKMEAPSSFVDKLMQAFAGWKRQILKAGNTGNVLSIGIKEDVESLNLQNMEGPYALARMNIMKNCATACGMPVTLLAQETLQEGFGEGTEDAKKEAEYLKWLRKDMQPLYDFTDRIVMRKAWSQEFYETMRFKYPEYKRMPYATALQKWIVAFHATWPNPLEEPESEKAKMADVQLKAAVAYVESVAPHLDPQNLANLIVWSADQVNEKPELFAGKLDIDITLLTEHLEEAKEQAAEAQANEAAMKEPKAPATFSGRS